MLNFTQPRELFDFLERKRCSGLSVGFVPTMGALHAGHLRMVEIARAESDIVLVSIFVNPNQFNDLRDFNMYPRDMERDTKLLQSVGADVIFAPNVEDIYPQPSRVALSLSALWDSLEGRFRQGHFSGVALVVAKLFTIVGPCGAYFGEKDYQQLRLIQELVREFHFPIQIRSVHTVRESDGLALSSRNVLLGDRARECAPAIYESFRLGQELATLNQPSDIVLDKMATAIAKRADSHGVIATIDYLELVQPSTFTSIDSFQPMSRFFCAVTFDGVRLIDNMAVFE